MSKLLLGRDCYRVALNELNRSGGQLRYSPKEWVPDEFEALERDGLVRCEFGEHDPFASTLRARVITMTDRGRDAANRLSDVRSPIYVRYSFRDALYSE